MRLRQLLKDVAYEVVQGNLELEILDITYNSREADKNKAFVALKGFRVDGYDYIDKAIELGCKCVIVSDDDVVNNGITVIKLEDMRVDLSKISRTFFWYPNKKIRLLLLQVRKGRLLLVQ